MDDCDIIFLNSPIYADNYNDGEQYLPPLGQGYIVTQLNNNGIKAMLIDCVYKRMSISDIVLLINDGTFNNVGMNVFSVNLKIIKRIIEGVNRKINWFFGGKAMGSLWKYMLSWNWKCNSVTYTIGECDLLYLPLLLNKCVEKPIFQKGNQKVYEIDKYSNYFPSNLDECKLDRKLFVGREIINHYGRLESCLVASRGCIYNCAFCGGAVYANPNSYSRSRSENSIIGEINEINKLNNNVESIRILDDLFLKNKEGILHAIDIFNHFPNMHWRAMAHVSSLKHNTELFKSLRNSGCDELFIGIESGSSVIRKKIRKLGTVEDVCYVISELLKSGIDVKGYFICGFPNETMQQMKDTVDLAYLLKKISSITEGDFRATAFQFRPYHGTELYDQLKNTGLSIGDYSICDGTSSKKQYSFILNNYSFADEVFVKDCIRKICEENT